MITVKLYKLFDCKHKEQNFQNCIQFQVFSSNIIIYYIIDYRYLILKYPFVEEREIGKFQIL